MSGANVWSISDERMNASPHCTSALREHAFILAFIRKCRRLWQESEEWSLIDSAVPANRLVINGRLETSLAFLKWKWRSDGASRPEIRFLSGIRLFYYTLLSLLIANYPFISTRPNARISFSSFPSLCVCVSLFFLLNWLSQRHDILT